MLVCIPDVLSKVDVAEFRAVMDAVEWEDGRSTAGAQSAEVKKNEQLPPNGEVSRKLGERVIRALTASPLFVSAAIPLHIFPPLFNRYGVGHRFGVHVDNAMRGDHLTGTRIRTDLSVTLFLSEPDEYDGGELVVEDYYGSHEVKLPAGQLVLYPATSLHTVTPITRGVRVASFFWLQSMIRDAHARSMIFDLDTAIQGLVERLGRNDPEVVKLSGLYHNLIRYWAEDNAVLAHAMGNCRGTPAAGRRRAAQQIPAARSRRQRLPLRNRRRRLSPLVQSPPPQTVPVQDAARYCAGGCAISGVGPLHDLSPWSMFMSADWLVKAVIVGLIFASLATWTILLAKTAQLFRARRQLGDNLRRIADMRSLNEAQIALGSTESVLGSLLSAAAQEIRMSAGSGSESGVKERAASRFSEIVKIRRARSATAWGSSPPSAQQRPSSACLAPLGHHEQLHRHFKGADDQSRRRRAGHRRGVAGDRGRSRRRDPGGYHLRLFFSRDEELSRSGRARYRCGRPLAVARSRSFSTRAISTAAE